jgi:hypothetical protein
MSSRVSRVEDTPCVRLPGLSICPLLRLRWPRDPSERRLTKERHCCDLFIRGARGVELTVRMASAAIQIT